MNNVVQLLGRPFLMTMVDLWLGDSYLSMRMISSIAWNYSKELCFDERVPSLDGIWISNTLISKRVRTDGYCLTMAIQTKRIIEGVKSMIISGSIHLGGETYLSSMTSKSKGHQNEWSQLFDELLSSSSIHVKPPSADSPIWISVAPEQTQSTHQIIRSSNRLVHQVSPKHMLWVNCDKQTGNED